MPRKTHSILQKLLVHIELTLIQFGKGSILLGMNLPAKYSHMQYLLSAMQWSPFNFLPCCHGNKTVFDTAINEL